MYDRIELSPRVRHQNETGTNKKYIRSNKVEVRSYTRIFLYIRNRSETEYLWRKVNISFIIKYIMFFLVNVQPKKNYRHISREKCIRSLKIVMY